MIQKGPAHSCIACVSSFGNAVREIKHVGIAYIGLEPGKAFESLSFRKLDRNPANRLLREEASALRNAPV